MLVFQEHFWLVAIESKRAGIALEEAIAQILVYMLGSPNFDRPTFGMITNGGCFLFAKLVKTEKPLYALSDMFVLRRQDNDLYRVLKILKRLTSTICD